MVWLYEETQAKYPNTSRLARKLMLPFPLSCLVECGFSAVNDSTIAIQGEFGLKLTKFLPRIKSLSSRH